MVGHPIWNIAARLFCMLPLGEIPYRLNLFSALCGAGVVFFLFRLVTFILYDIMREKRWIRQMEEDLPVEAMTDVRGAVDEVATINATGHHIAMAGGVVSAMAFAFCTPFWLASTSLHTQTFELLLLLAAGYTLARYRVTASVICLVLAAFLLGLGAVESAVCLLFMPVLLLGFISGGYRHDHISGSFVVLLFLGLAAGVLLAGAAQVVWITRGEVSTPVLNKIAVMWFQSHTDGIKSMIAHKGWLVMLAQGLLPLLIVYAGRYYFISDHLLSPRVDIKERDTYPCFDSRNSHLSKLSWDITFFILFCSVAHVLLNLPGSPWYFSRESDYLPVLPLLGMAMTFGVLASYSLLFGYRHLLNHATRKEKALVRFHSRMAQFMSAGMLVVICSLIAVTVFKNQAELDGRKACFVDLVCREILSTAPEARCFVSDGMLDMNLLVQARLLKRNITLLNLKDSSRWHPSASPAAGKKTQTATEFLREWLVAHPEAYSQVAVLTTPRLWFDAGAQAIPSKFVYLGSKPNEKMDLKALLNEHRLFWKKIEPMLKGNEPRSYVLRHIQSAMRIQASRLANDLGVLCLHKEAKEDARAAFSLALDMDANNLCAMVNQYTPESVNLETKKGDPFHVLMKRITVAMGSTPSFDSFSDWEERYGTLYLNAVENLANLCNKVPDARNPDTRSPVIQQSRDYVRAAIHASSEPLVTPSSLKDETVDEEVIKVVESIREGYPKAAETQVRTLLRKRRASLFLWSLLAEALMNQGKFAEVQNTVLPEMRLLAETKGSEWIEMTAGCLAMRQKKPDYQLAHDQFARVLQRKPDIEEVQNLLIQTALLLREPALIETDCLAVLAHSSRQPMANAVLGALRLNQDRLEDAEKAVRISIASHPSSPALNDLGEILRRMQRFQAAEGVTRRALLLQPEYYQAWDTLALILKEQGRLDEASEAHHAALRLCKDDIRLYLNAAKLEQARADFKAVSQLLKESAPLLSNAAPVYKDEYNSLAKSMTL